MVDAKLLTKACSLTLHLILAAIPLCTHSNNGLLKDETAIGRNSMVVDCYINSSLHPKLISREHAIISQTRTENGMVELTIQDRSVNGTFVNDKKIQGSIHISVGDTVTFGHLQGIRVKPWEVAKQPNSEFRFKIEEVTEQQPICSPSSVRRSLSSCKNSPSKTLADDGSSNRQPLGSYNHNQSNKTLNGDINKTLSVSVKDAVRKIENIPAGTHDEKIDQETRNGLKLKLTRRSSPLSNCHVGLVGSVSDTKGKDADSQEIKENCNRDEQRLREIREITRREGAVSCEPISNRLEGDDCITSSFSESIVLPPSDILPKQLILGVPACRVQPVTQQKTFTVERKFDFPFLSRVESTSAYKNDETGDGDSTIESDEDIFAITSKVKSKVERLLDEEEEEDSFSPKFPSFSDDALPTSLGTAGTSIGGINNSTRFYNDRRKSIPQSGVKPATSFSSTTELNARKRKSDGVLPSAKRTTTEFEVCSASECLRPTGIMIPWVQCDDCDQWFHTSCAGCKFEEVRKSSAAFRCGCL
ncbi:uncharacterized protein [Apostichopus japonicus]|uniref:uncharacterized protein isoform X1 n=1 Tax=Stichopus japonicus TaxID=307972 RepID=UPI003AB2FE52